MTTPNTTTTDGGPDQIPPSVRIDFRCQWMSVAAMIKPEQAAELAKLVSNFIVNARQEKETVL